MQFEVGTQRHSFAPGYAVVPAPLAEEVIFSQSWHSYEKYAHGHMRVFQHTQSCSIARSVYPYATTLSQTHCRGQTVNASITIQDPYF